MNDTDEQPMLIPQSPLESAPDHSELENDLISLRAIVFRVVIGLLILTTGINLFIWRQVRIVRTQLADERRQIEEYQKADPAIRDLMRRLQVFAASHPDFQPIIGRYNVSSNTTATKK